MHIIDDFQEISLWSCVYFTLPRVQMYSDFMSLVEEVTIYVTELVIISLVSYHNWLMLTIIDGKKLFCTVTNFVLFLHKKYKNISNTRT